MTSAVPSRYSRRRAACLCAVYLLMGLHVVHGRIAGRTLAPLEFSEALHTLHLGIVTAGAVFLVAATVGTAVFGRFFCGWACHILALEDLCVALLARAGIRPGPPRSKALVWGPAALALYLFAWPQVERLARGEAWPGFSVQTTGWGSFVTDDVLRRMPGPWLSLATLAVCGFVIVWVLGSRSFCSIVCPYGALFRVADRAAPGRIVLAGGCTSCGLCTAGCLSGVQVSQELRLHGAVVDPQCVRCLDCVGRCPERAISFGFATPPLLRGLPRPERSLRPSAFTFAEEAALAGLSAAAFLALRGLYDELPVLLSAAAAATSAFVWVLSLRLARRRDASWRGRRLRTPRGLTREGFGLAAAGLLLGAAVAHGGYVRYQDWRGQAWLEEAGRRPSPAALREALDHLEKAHRWGLLHPLRLERQLAGLKLRLGLSASAEPHLRRVAAEAPDDPEAALLLGRVLARSGRTGEAEARLARALRLSEGKPPAIEEKTLLGLGALLADLGRLEESAVYFRRALESDPGSATAAHDLAVVEAGLRAQRMTTSLPRLRPPSGSSTR